MFLCPRMLLASWTIANRSLPKVPLKAKRTNFVTRRVKHATPGYNRMAQIKYTHQVKFLTSVIDLTEHALIKHAGIL